MGAMMRGHTEPEVASLAEEIAASAEEDLAALVDVSTPSGDVAGAEQAIALCIERLPPGMWIERPACSTVGGAPDLDARLGGRGRVRLLLLGHLDTVHDHAAHRPLEARGERLYGPGAVDMKGGCVLALGVARALARQPERFAELAVLLVTDEEWRTGELRHVGRFAGYDACLCFEGGELSDDGEEAVVVRRKAAATLRILARGEAAHSGSAPHRGANALVALARATVTIAARGDPSGPEQLTIVPTVVRAGDAFNVVPAAGELLFDMRARSLEAFEPVLDAVPGELDGVSLQAEFGRRWPGMDSEEATRPVLARASELLGRPLRPAARGGASDASHFAPLIPLTIDGLGPRGGGAHTPAEFVLRSSLRARAEVALAVALSALEVAAAAK
jgi:glutamate carboxypeptidase